MKLQFKVPILIVFVITGLLIYSHAAHAVTFQSIAWNANRSVIEVTRANGDITQYNQSTADNTVYIESGRVCPGRLLWGSAQGFLREIVILSNKRPASGGG